MPTLSVLDLSPICEDGDAAQALNNSRALAQHCENAGYHRYWVAEHHNMRGIASAATSVLMATLLQAQHPYGSDLAASCCPITPH